MVRCIPAAKLGFHGCRKLGGSGDELRSRFDDGLDHEAGHAVIARALGVGVVHIALFSLDPGSRGGAQSRSASWLAPADDLLAQIAGYEIDAKVSLAGPQAQLSYRPGRMRWEHEWSSDLAYARSFIARSVLLKHGVKLSSDPQPFTLSSAQFRRGRTSSSNARSPRLRRWWRHTGSRSSEWRRHWSNVACSPTSSLMI